MRLIDMPELGDRDGMEAATLAGLAPLARQSGTWKGRSFIHGGRAGARQALYMTALVAAGFNPNLKAKYDQLVAAGKPAKVALTAIVRKFLVLANGPSQGRPHKDTKTGLITTDTLACVASA